MVNRPKGRSAALIEAQIVADKHPVDIEYGVPADQVGEGRDAPLHPAAEAFVLAEMVDQDHLTAPAHTLSSSRMTRSGSGTTVMTYMATTVSKL